MKALQAGVPARRLEAVGLLYVLVIALLVWVSIASYQHVFTDHVTVVVKARQAGQQLNVGGDVRMNGAIVGRVSAVDGGPNGVRVSLQIDSGDARRIPRDVVARILPTTLFGQKFVELSSSSTTAAGHLVNGSVIAEDRSAEAVELTDVLDDLDPVLRAVHPEQLSAALGGLADGLSGHGQDLADLLNAGGRYLGELNEQTPTFERDLALLQRVSGQYAVDAPDFLALLRNATVTSRSLTARPDTVSAFIAAVTGAATSGTSLVKANADRLAESAQLARPISELLAEYSPELVCTIGGFLQVEAESAKQIRNGSFQGHFTIGAQARGYTPADALVLGDLGTGPACRGLPVAPIPYGAVNLNDGAGDTSLAGLLMPGGAR
ncbi:MCE family protein [Nocardioides marmorisolisilvae]|uniref:MCE family protein n=1 Tax=Nocardioides marmorisolisilvae TaxID=1542737 RepID=UPI00160A2621|nr:MCE family protein [Nocardioides marmorisolisilvae]